MAVKVVVAVVLLATLFTVHEYVNVGELTQDEVTPVRPAVTESLLKKVLPPFVLSVKLTLPSVGVAQRASIASVLLPVGEVAGEFAATVAVTVYCVAAFGVNVVDDVAAAEKDEASFGETVQA